MTKKLCSYLLIFSIIFGFLPVQGAVSMGFVLKDVDVEKARYNTGETVNVILELESTEDQPKLASIGVSVFHLNEEIEYFTKVITIPSGKSEQSLTWQPPTENYQGYMIKVTLPDGSYKTVGVDVSNDFTRYPRYGYTVDFPIGEEEATSKGLMKKLAREYHINVVQYYDWMYRHEQNFPDTGNTWIDLFGNAMSEASIANRIEGGHEANQAAMAYQMVYMAREDYEDYGVKREWGIYKNRDYNISYDKNNPSTINNIDQLTFPLEGNPNPVLMILNPADKNWQDHMINQYKEGINRVGFDGIQIDQMGDFWGDISYYDYYGNFVDMGKTFSSFINEARKQLDANNPNKAYLTMNMVNGAVPGRDNFSTWDITKNGQTDFQFSELWQHTNSYDGIQKFVEWQKTQNPDQTMVFAAYMNQHDNLGIAYQAELASMNGVHSGSENGITFVTGFDAVGDRLTFNVNVPEDGAYPLIFKFANGAGQRAVKAVYVDGIKKMTANFDPTRTGLVPADPSWQQYSYEAAFTEPKLLYLKAGQHTISLTQEEAGQGDIRVDTLTLGRFNEPSVRLTNAAIAASGAMHIEMGSGMSLANADGVEGQAYSENVMLGHPYYPKAFKTMSQSLKSGMERHYDFITAYENLLYGPDINFGDGGLQNVEIAGKEVSGNGQSEKIWFLNRTKGETGILHLINLAKESNTDWRDDTNEVETYSNLTVKAYVPEHKTVTEAYMASPDRNQGLTESISFTQGTDSQGRYVTFSVPELKYWDMIYFNYGNESEPTIYEAEKATKKGVSTNNNHGGYTGTGFVDGYGDLYDSVTFNVEVPEDGYYTLKMGYANATGNECSRLLFVDNSNRGKISFQPLNNWGVWGTAEKGTYLKAGRHQLVILVTDEYGGFINLDNLTIEPLEESTRGVYLNNWEDTVYLWKETVLNPAGERMADGPSIYEMRYFTGQSNDNYNRNELKNYSMFMRDESANKVYTTGSKWRAEGAFDVNGTFNTEYVSYNGQPLDVKVERNYSALPGQNFMLVEYKVTNQTSSNKTVKILDMFHPQNESGQLIEGWYDTSRNTNVVDMTMTGNGQYVLFQGAFDSVESYQIANDQVSSVNASDCSPWHTFNGSGQLKNNGYIKTGDISTALMKEVQLSSRQTKKFYFYIGIGKNKSSVESHIDFIRTKTAQQWKEAMSASYNNWLAEGKTTSLEDEELNDAYNGILVALKQSIVPGKDENNHPKFAALPATTNPSAYSYKVWARDSAVTGMSLDATGHLEEAESYWFWLADRQIKNDEGGWKKPGTFWTCYWIWDNNPVSFVEPEYDSIGMFLVGIYRHYEMLPDNKKAAFLSKIWTDYRRSADFALTNIQSNGFGLADCSIWEEQTEYNAFTQALFAAGLDAAAKLAKAKNLNDLADSYNGGASTIRSAIQRQSHNQNPGLFNETDPNNRYYNRAVNLDGTPRTTVDASSDVLVTYGVIDMLSKRAYDHYEKVTGTISHDEYGITRYEGDTFYTGKNSWDPGGVEAFEDEPSWPQMSMWAAQMEIYSGYDSLKTNAYRRLQWFVRTTAKGYAPQGEAVSNVTLKPCISTMIEPITGAAYLMTALAYEGQFDMRIMPDQYNAGARKTINIHNGCVNTNDPNNHVSDFSEWAYVPYYLDNQGDSEAGGDVTDIKKVYISNDDQNIYIRVDNVARVLPSYNQYKKFAVTVYSEDFSGNQSGNVSQSLYGTTLSRPMRYVVTRKSNSGDYEKYEASQSGSWLQQSDVSAMAPQWEPGSGRVQMVIPISQLSTGGAGNGAWANMIIGLSYQQGNGAMEDGDFINIHYRLTGSNEDWLFGNSEE